jgi:hypothetical protein
MRRIKEVWLLIYRTFGVRKIISDLPWKEAIKSLWAVLIMPSKCLTLFKKYRKGKDRKCESKMWCQIFFSYPTSYLKHKQKEMKHKGLFWDLIIFMCEHYYFAGVNIFIKSTHTTFKLCLRSKIMKKNCAILSHFFPHGHRLIIFQSVNGYTKRTRDKGGFFAA